MKSLRLASLLGAFALALSACAASNQASVKTFQKKDVDFSSYETIAFGGPAKMPKGYTRQQLPERLVPVAREVFRTTFREKGYEVVEDYENADLVLVGGVGSKEKTISNPTPVKDSGMFSVAMPQMSVETGAIALDVFDPNTGAAVWGGKLEKVLEEGAAPVTEEQFRTALSRLFESFPARSTGDAAASQPAQ